MANMAYQLWLPRLGNLLSEVKMRIRNGALVRLATIALATVLSATTLTATSASATSCPSELFAGGTGAEGSPFQISNPAQLIYISACASEDYWFAQTQDIDMGSYLLWSGLPDFHGQYDGANNSITGIDLSETSSGLFERVTEGSVKNLEISGTITNTESFSSVGMVTGLAQDSVIDNIKVIADLTVTSSAIATGGVVGYSDNSTLSNLEFSTLTENGDISADSMNTGGIVGYLTGSSASNLKVNADLYNISTFSNTGGAVGYSTSGSSVTNAEVTADLTSEYGTSGGVIGYASDSTFSDLHHTGFVKVLDVDAFMSAGGIVGYAGTTSISNVSHHGDVLGYGGAGGVLGYFGTDSSISNATVSGNLSGGERIGGISANQQGAISNVTFSGTITGTKYLGGITGYCSGYIDFSNGFNELNSTISNGKVDVDITTLEDPDNNSGWTFVGGISGDTIECDISNVSAKGSVTGENFVGGASGYISESTLTGVSAEVDVTATGEEIGGFAGYLSDSTLSKVFSKSSVIGLGAVGGAFGRAYTSTVSDSYFVGNVDSSGLKGNLAGYSDSLTISHVYVSVAASDGDMDLIGMGSNGQAFPTLIQNSSVDSTEEQANEVTYLDATQMKNTANFAAKGWNFSNVWAVMKNVNDGMPILRAAIPDGACSVKKFATFYFKKGNFKLDAKSKKKIKTLAKTIANSPCTSIKVNGFTSIFEKGSKKSPKSVLKKIAGKRIGAVLNLLKPKLDAVRDGYQVTSFNGFKAKQIGKYKTKSGQNKNRRVEIQLLG